MPITVAWHQAINCLNRYPHDKDEIWHMANAKVKGAMPSKILEIKNNPPEPVDIVLIPNPKTFLDIETDPEKFYEHYQNLAPTREEQEQCLEHSSSIPYDNNNDNNLDLDSNSNLNHEQYIALSNLTKEQELKLFSDNNEGIMPECVHDTDADEELGITTKEIQDFGLTDRIDVPINMAEEEIVDKEEIISIHQSISIPPYD
ncbi:hypothetical protein G9A89_011113 [Geosiphon pyriformis]|nr:hypothetical protein G9A89_011113 [Geosiphon pyriformis]